MKLGRRQPLSPRAQRVVISALLAIGLTGIGYALATSTTGEERLNLPEEIEAIRPVPDGVAQRQQSIFVDLAPGYTGSLIIDGVEPKVTDLSEISPANPQPGQQVVIPPDTLFESGNFTLSFTPSDDAVVKPFEAGAHTVTVVYWKIIDGRDTAQIYSWTFEVF